MTKKILIMVSTAMLIALVGCSQEMVEVTTTTKPSTTIVATTTTTTIEVVTTTTTQPQTTMAETTSTTKHTTTKPTTTKPKPTTENATTRKSTITAVTERTTQKQTTTKKVTTTTSYCKGKNDHWMPNGNVGKWYNSKGDFKAEYMAESNKWNAKLDNEEIDWDTYIHSVTGGYELWSCPSCGKWTDNYKYKQ